MRFAARVFFRFVVFLLFFALLFPALSQTASAQTTPYANAGNSATRLNTESNVPHNQHTYMQAMFIETLLALQCQLTGIDLTNPTQSCLGINLETGKMGYAPSSAYQAGLPPIGGVLGMLNNGIAATYTPSFNTNDYVRYMANNFGIVKNTYAAPTNAFDGFGIILNLWKTTRDLAYFLLTIAFIFIGIGVMMRIHIDPRTVMTVQNQIPRIIICIILITFSYAFAALLADAMWVVTYMGINKLTETVDPSSYHVCGGAGGKTSFTLQNYATTQIIQTPFGFVDDIFATTDCLQHRPGILRTSWIVGINLSSIEWDILMQMVGIKINDCSVGNTITAVALSPILGPLALPAIGLDFLINGGSTVKSIAACVIGNVFGGIIKWFTNFAWFLIVLVIILVTLFRIWFELLKAYIMVLIYIILAPLWIVFGLLPKKPLGFEKWLRAYFAHLAVFPATVFMLVLARLFYELFSTQPDSVFVPPLVGNPYVGNFGAILEFGMLLMTPTILSILREKLGTPPLKQAAAIGQGFAVGRGAAGAVAGKTWAGVTRRNPTTGQGEAALSQGSDFAKQWLKRKAFERGTGWFAAKPGAKENLLQKIGRQSAERSKNLYEGRGRVTDDQAFGGRLQSVLDTNPAARTDSQRRLLGDYTHALSSDQKAQLEKQSIALTIQLNNGESQQLDLPLNKNAKSTFISMAAPQHRAAVEADWDQRMGDMSSSSTHALSNEQLQRATQFAEQHAKAGHYSLGSGQGSTPPPSAPPTKV